MHAQTQARAILVNYYCIAPKRCHTREERLQWAAEQFTRTHPMFSRAKAYRIAEEATQ